MLKLIHQVLTQRYASNFFSLNLNIEITAVENKNIESNVRKLLLWVLQMDWKFNITICKQ